jgi:hypothetical protein
LEQEGVERIPGAHCYEFFAGSHVFEQLAQQELGTFYLTDFLLQHFDRLIIRGMGIDKHPELLPIYFGNYTKLTYLAQVVTPEKIAAGQVAAQRLDLKFEYRVTGYGQLATSLDRFATAPTTSTIAWQN